jgi:hypothetical protein
MQNPLILCEVAKLKQRDILVETALRQIANQAKAGKITRPDSVKWFVMVGHTLLKKLIVPKKMESVSPGTLLEA